MHRVGGTFSDILVIDDDIDFFRRIRLTLQSAGYSVRGAASIGDAVKAVQERLPDLVLLDAGLSATNGHQFVRDLKREREFVPIIVTQDEGVLDVAPLDAGADDMLLKPVSNVVLLVRIRAALRVKEMADALAEMNDTLEQRVAERTRELEAAHASLRHAEKLSALGRMAASIAHEINNPLSAMLLHLDFMARAVPDDSDLQEDLVMMEQQVKKIARLVRQLRDFSRPPSRDRRPVILNDVVRQVLALTGKDLQRHRVKVSLELDPDLLPVMASADQMGEIFMNLILNARDAMPGGGRLTISTMVKGKRVVARVADTGGGIPPEAIERVFEPFFTTKGEHGTGLGLAIAHSIARDHGGEIRVESEVGKGAVFTLSLPALSEE